MSTNSFIGTLRPTGYVKGIYCHWDGYPEYAGTILNYHYKSLNKIEKLLSLGNISILGENVYPLEEGHTFDRALPKTVVAYHRDRGEEYCSPINFNIKTFPKKFKYYVDYMYLFDIESGKWRTFEVDISIKSLKELPIDYNLFYKEAVKLNYMNPLK